MCGVCELRFTAYCSVCLLCGCWRGDGGEGVGVGYQGDGVVMRELREMSGRRCLLDTNAVITRLAGNVEVVWLVKGAD